MSKRTVERENVFVSAELVSGGNTYYGSILDQSEHGAFFRAESGVVGSRYVLAPDPSLPTDATVELTKSEEGQEFVATARVRWMGAHETHTSVGLGLELQSDWQASETA